LVALRTMSPSYSPMRSASSRSASEADHLDVEAVLAERIAADGL